VAESAYCAAMLALWQLNSMATTWVFLVPFAVTSFALMFGNWYALLVLSQQRCAPQLSLMPYKAAVCAGHCGAVLGLHSHILLAHLQEPAYLY
jgi:hypothetical protein